MITLSTAPGQAARTVAMSSRTASWRPSFSAPIGITMSISCAPAAIAAAVSAALTADGMAPSGKPTTEQTRTSLPRSRSATNGTCTELTQTERKPCVRASSQNRATCASVASALRIVWSISSASAWPRTGMGRILLAPIRSGTTGC